MFTDPFGLSADTTWNCQDENGTELTKLECKHRAKKAEAEAKKPPKGCDEDGLGCLKVEPDRVEGPLTQEQAIAINQAERWGDWLEGVLGSILLGKPLGALGYIGAPIAVGVLTTPGGYIAMPGDIRTTRAWAPMHYGSIGYAETKYVCTAVRANGQIVGCD